MTSARDTGGPIPAARVEARPGAVVAVLVAASFVVVLDFAGAIVLLPSIQAELGGTLDELTWVVAAFVLTFTVLFLPAARAAEVLGRRRLLVGGVVLVVGASLVAALSPSLGVLLAARVAQGAGAAMVEPAVFALITAVIPPERRRWAFDMQGGVFLLGAASGPVLPAALATVLSWRFLFWLNVLLGAVIVLGAFRVVPRSRAAEPPPGLDVPGLVLGAAALFGLFFAAIDGPRLGWASAPILVAAGGGAVLSAGFVVTESRAAHPLVDLGLFHDRFFTIGNVARAATEFTSLGIFLPLSHFLQVGLGHSPVTAGLVLTSVIAGALITAPLAERLSARVDLRWLTVPGFVLVAAGTFWVAHLSSTTGWGFVLAPLAVVGAGIGALEHPAETATRRRIPASNAATAWRVSYTVYVLGIGLGVAVVSSIWQSTADRGPATAVNLALLGCAAVAAAGAVITSFLTTRTEPTARHA